MPPRRWGGKKKTNEDVPPSNTFSNGGYAPRSEAVQPVKKSIPNTFNKNEDVVAIIGGGISGLALAYGLSAQGIRSEVYDTGRVRSGGRCTSRVLGEFQSLLSKVDGLPSDLMIDYSTQVVFDVDKCPLANDLLKGLVSSNQLKKCDAMRISLPSSSSTKVNEPCYIGTKQYGLGGIAHHLEKQASSHSVTYLDQWVHTLQFNPEEKMWSVKYGKKTTKYRYVAIAHCGKCADKLISTAHPRNTLAHPCLKCVFARESDTSLTNGTVQARAIKKMNRKLFIESTYICVIAVKTKKSIPPVTIIENHPTLTKICNNTTKYSTPSQTYQIVTLTSTPAFAAQHKHPQEHIPLEAQQSISKLLINSFTDLQGEMECHPLVIKLWGAATPCNILTGDGFVHDSDNNIGVVGDWLVAPNLNGALESGLRLAQHFTTGFGETVGGNDVTFIPR